MTRTLHIILLILNMPVAVMADVQQRSASNGQLLLQDIPEIPHNLADSLGPYHNLRFTGFVGWTLDGKSIYIRTRRNGVNQIHRVAKPGSTRRQMTFGEEPVGEVVRAPNGKRIAYTMNRGGSGFDQIFLLSPQRPKPTRLTDGQSLNNRMVWDHSAQKLAYRSTRRNGRSNDIWIMDVAAPDQARLLLGASDGALWKPVDFSTDGKSLLIQYYASITDSRIYLLNIETGALSLLVGSPDLPSSNVASGFDHDDRGVWFISNQRGQSAEIGWISVSGEDPIKFGSKTIRWDINEFTLSPDGKRGAFVSNEEGISRLYLFDPAKMSFQRVRRTPVGVISSLRFNLDGRQLGMSLSTARAPSDAFVLKLGHGPLSARKIVRWTHGEMVGLNADRFIQPQLIHYPAPLIGAEKYIAIPAFIYQPRGRGPFPVVIYIHGGPEGQFRPSFNSTIQMWVQKLRVAVIAPNVRGSLGYGEAYLAMDDGVLREHAVQDIGALLDWIGTQKKFDASRIAVYGASYGGYLSLASAVHYSDRIRAAVDHAGISNFVTYLENTQDYRRDLRRVEYGDERDPEMRAFLEKISPLNNVDKISVPLLIVQGQNDPVVPVSESEQMVRALRKRDQPVWYLNALNEGHVYQKKENRDIFQQVTFMFLQQYLLQ